MKYDYTLATVYDIAVYETAKATVSNSFPDYIAEKEWIDPLDGTMVQELHKGDDKIKVVNDFMVGAVFVESTVRIDAFEE